MVELMFLQVELRGEGLEPRVVHGGSYNSEGKPELKYPTIAKALQDGWCVVSVDPVQHIARRPTRGPSPPELGSQKYWLQRDTKTHFFKQTLEELGARVARAVAAEMGVNVDRQPEAERLALFAVAAQVLKEYS